MQPKKKMKKKKKMTSKKCGWASLRASDFSDFRQNGIFSVYFVKKLSKNFFLYFLLFRFNWYFDEIPTQSKQHWWELWVLLIGIASDSSSWGPSPRCWRMGRHRRHLVTADFFWVFLGFSLVCPWLFLGCSSCSIISNLDFSKFDLSKLVLKKAL